jgi:hypothetical protein
MTTTTTTATKAMSTAQFKTTYEKKGWTPVTLAHFWGFTAATRIHQIANSPSMLQVCAVNGLPMAPKEIRKVKNRNRTA